MTDPVTVDQLRNLADRAAAGLTPAEQQRLRDGVNRLEHAEAELARLRADINLDRAQQWPQRLARAEAATDGELRRQLADVIRALGKAETELAGVRTLRDRWIKAGPPPLGQPISRWWDRRLAELGAALQPTAHNDGPSIREAAADDRRWPLQKTGE